MNHTYIVYLKRLEHFYPLMEQGGKPMDFPLHYLVSKYHIAPVSHISYLNPWMGIQEKKVLVFQGLSLYISQFEGLVLSFYCLIQQLKRYRLISALSELSYLFEKSISLRVFVWFLFFCFFFYGSFVDHNPQIKNNNINTKCPKEIS